jgi:UTP--glucose-1-phosphate uridylyltransferase
MNKVTKAVITCGGYATRFLPITKAVPKEMLPILDKPIIHYIIEEMVEAGITDIQIQCGRGREVLMNYFDMNYELDDTLAKKGKKIQTNFFPNVNFSYRRVPLPRGFADAVWHAKQFVDSDHFLLAVCDGVYFEGNPSLELVKDFEIHGKSAITATEVPWSEVDQYGVFKSNKPITGDTFEVDSIIEKPKTNPPSNLIIPGRYLLSSKVFSLIEDDMKTVADDKEVDLTAQFCKLASMGELRGVKTNSLWFDVGHFRGFVDVNKYAFEKFGEKK